MDQKNATAGVRARTHDEIRQHYLIEKELAQRLRTCAADQRTGLYSVVYDELLRRVPSHPILKRKDTPHQRERAIAWQLQFLRRFIRPSQHFMEIGAGDCALSLSVAKHVERVTAVEVSATLTDSIVRPANFQLLLTDGCSVNLPNDTVDIAYSNQLMEHLHPDDAQRQLSEVHRTLKPGGAYICVTPNRVGGPYDISRRFDQVATGLHLKEYTVAEAAEAFRRVGFRRVRAYIGARGCFVAPPLGAFVAAETLFSRIPHRYRLRLGSWSLLRPLMMIRIVGVKS
jgi:SAM-dependent methyltransferase